MRKYKSAVIIKARAYFLIGADHDDVIQEGMIGLYKAIQEYEAEKGASFRTFSDICITRQMLSAIKAASRQKHMPLNKYIPFDTEDDCYANSPEDIFIGNESKTHLESIIGKSLTQLEKSVLFLYLEGRSYIEIAQILGKNEKSIDNSIQRVRKKVGKSL